MTIAERFVSHPILIEGLGMRDAQSSNAPDTPRVSVVGDESQFRPICGEKAAKRCVVTACAAISAESC
ncbi:MAG: hypothetical protein KF764_09805 [Labilithrix sp.]|nr:hypothetical protein [Labilithrix sp.]